MTRQIHLKINAKLFKPLLDELDPEDALSTNYNDLVAKCVFWAYLNKASFPKGIETLKFLRLYKRFKRKGVTWVQKHINQKS